MTDIGTMVIAEYVQPLAYAQDFHVEFDYFLTEDPGEDYTAFQLSNRGTLSLNISSGQISVIGITPGSSTIINETYPVSGNVFGYFNKVHLTMTYLGDTGSSSTYMIQVKFNNSVQSTNITVDTTQISELFAPSMQVKFNGFSGTQLKNIVFNEVSCTNLGATCVQLLHFDNDDTISLIYDHSGNENDVTDASNAELVLKNV